MAILRRAAAILIAVGVLAAGQPAARAAPSVRLVYVRGPGAERCPSEAAVRAAVSARLGYDPFLDWARETMFIEIQRGPRAFRVLVKSVGADNLQRGAREIAVRGNDCSAVIDAMGLSVSLAIDAGAGSRPDAPVAQPGREEPPIPAPTQAVPSATPAVIAVAVPRAPTAATRAPLALRVGMGVVGTLNAAPSSTAGAALFLGARWRMLSLDLEGRADAPVAGDSAVPAVSVRSWLVAGALVPCAHTGAVFGCVVLAAGQLGATARNVPVAVVRHGPWSAAGGRAGAEWNVLPAVSVQAYAQLLATLTRDTLWIDAMRVYTVPAWSAGVGLAVAWRFL